MFDITGRKVASKWAKTAVLLADEHVAKHIPETKKFTSTNLEEMLDKYGMVVVKPMIGTGGHGIIKISKQDEGYHYTFYHHSKNITEWKSLLSAINKIRKKRTYLIQQGIKLATIQGRPIDYRVKIQKPNNVWLITGMVGRLARRGYFVTNLCKGGKRLTFVQGIKRSLTEDIDLKELRKEIRSVTRICTNLLEREYPGIRKLGFDYGVDQKGDFWIFEVNTNPR